MTHPGRRLSLQTILALDAATCAAVGMLLVFASEPHPSPPGPSR